MGKNVDKPGSFAMLHKQLRRFHIVVKHLVDSFFTGSYGSVFRGPGLEFQEVRHYVAGDDIRFIDWNVSSRLGGTYCKIFNEERDISLMFLLDVSSSMTMGLNGSKIRMLQEIFLLLGFAALSHGDKVGSIAFDEQVTWFIPAKSGSYHLLDQLKKIFNIAKRKQFYGSNLAQALRVMGETMKRRGICIIISDFKMDNYWRELTILSRRHEVIAIRIEDVLDTNFPRVGYLAIRDTEEGQLAHFFPSTRKFQRMYHQYWNSFHMQWKQNCHRRGVGTVSIHGEDDILGCLASFLKKRRVKK